MTVSTQDNGATSTLENEGLNTLDTSVSTPSEDVSETPKVEDNQPYKVFRTQKEFDDHAKGILNSAQRKAEKELLSMLGLKPDEKNKLAKFKEAYENTLSENEKKVLELNNIISERDALKNQIMDNNALIYALSKVNNKDNADVSQYVKMAKGLVDENTTIEQALDKVISMTSANKKSSSIPKGTPIMDAPAVQKKTSESNPFKTGNLTSQAYIKRTDVELARTLYREAKGREPNW